MTNPAFTLAAESPADQPAIEHILDLTFGLERRTKTSYRLREGNRPAAELSFVAKDAELGLVGAISFWPLKIGSKGSDALLLGPLAVHPERQNIGIGRALMHAGIGKARSQAHRLIILVGDEPYYARVGFRCAPLGRFIMPGPVDPKLAEGALADAEGLVLPPHRYQELSASFAVPHRTEAGEQQPEAYQG
jgi:predicted N-acetyltransferase YhbS